MEMAAPHGPSPVVTYAVDGGAGCACTGLRWWIRPRLHDPSTLAGRARAGGDGRGSGHACASGDGRGLRRCSLHQRKKRKGKVEADRKERDKSVGGFHTVGEVFLAYESTSPQFVFGPTWSSLSSKSQPTIAGALMCHILNIDNFCYKFCQT
jgi:hypothetical protein